jgi:hypothetical protein
MDSINIVKASGVTAAFDPQKLVNSLVRSGAGQAVAREILGKVESIIHDGMTTKKIYREAYRLLKKRSRSAAGRYKLKKAIMELGPSGYPFEHFIGALLQNRGYNVKVGQMVQGKCVQHEVDVVAENDHDHFMVECKFHSDASRKSTVRVPLYIHSRFEDIFNRYKKLPGHKTKLHQSWIVTNTKFTQDAIDYAECTGLKLVSWDYPTGGSLKDWIDLSGLHPITCMQSLRKNEKKVLLKEGIVMCRDLGQNIDKMQELGLTEHVIDLVCSEAEELCRDN